MSWGGGSLLEDIPPEPMLTWIKILFPAIALFLFFDFSIIFLIGIFKRINIVRDFLSFAKLLSIAYVVGFIVWAIIGQTDPIRGNPFNWNTAVVSLPLLMMCLFNFFFVLPIIFNDEFSKKKYRTEDPISWALD